MSENESRPIQVTHLSQQDLLQTGEMIFARTDAVGKSIWLRKLVLAEPDQIAQVNKALRSRSFSTYRSVVESFQCPVQRLVTLHLCNALLANRVPIADAYDIDVAAWGPTSEMATSRRPYSLTPLLGAYADTKQRQNFAEAYAAHAVGKLVCLHSAVRPLYHNIILSIAEPVLQGQI